jgi:hypothetical protein
MRGAYLYRKPKPPTKKMTMGPLIAPPSVAAPSSFRVTPTLVEDEDDFFLPMDDECSSRGDPDDSVFQGTSGAALHPCSSSSLLDPIVEQPGTDIAMAILEDFFFGTSRQTQKLVQAAKHQQQQQQQLNYTSGDFQTSSARQSATSCNVGHEVESSPKSVAMCSCPEERTYLFTGLQALPPKGSQESSVSNELFRRGSSCSPKPKKPTLKNRISSNSSLCSSNRNVSFTEISVREYDVELSDHPSCSFGPPIQLGWEYEEKEKIPVEDYEGSRSPRREVHELVLSYNARRRLLKQSGYKKKEILAVEKEVDRIKRERLVTEFFLPYSAIDETIEKVFVGVKQLFRPKQSCMLHP